MTQGDLFGTPKRLTLDELGVYLGGLLACRRKLSFAFVSKTLIEPGHIRQTKDDCGELAFLVVRDDAVRAWAVELALVEAAEWPTRTEPLVHQRPYSMWWTP